MCLQSVSSDGEYHGETGTGECAGTTGERLWGAGAVAGCEATLWWRGTSARAGAGGSRASAGTGATAEAVGAWCRCGGWVCASWCGDCARAVCDCDDLVLRVC